MALERVRVITISDGIGPVCMYEMEEREEVNHGLYYEYRIFSYPDYRIEPVELDDLYFNHEHPVDENGGIDSTYCEYGDGHLIAIYNYNRGRLNGPFEEFFFDNETDKGTYVNGVKEGIEKHYYVDRQTGEEYLKGEGCYSEGKRIGIWKEYDKEGKKSEKATIRKATSYTHLHLMRKAS